MLITAVSHDAGGAELISNYLKNKKKVQFVLKGPAKKYLKIIKLFLSLKLAKILNKIYQLN